MEAQETKRLFRPLLVCPAMNTMMWDHPITSEHLKKINDWGFTVVDPVSKVLMCGDKGKGAMANLETIVEALQTEFYLSELTAK
jgi:phosphopantothenoylcysteine decarboxylase